MIRSVALALLIAGLTGPTQAPVEVAQSSLPGCCISVDNACMPRAPIFPGGCPQEWTVITDPALCPAPCMAPTPTPTPTPSYTFTALPATGPAWASYVESGGWLQLADGSWLVTGETGWLAWPLPPDKPGETLFGVHYPTQGGPRRIEYARATDAQRPGDRGHEAAYLRIRHVGGQWVGLYAATWESTIGQTPRVGAGLIHLANGPLQPATAIDHDWFRPPTGVFPAGLVRIAGQWWLYGWDIGVHGQGLARWPVSDNLTVGAKQTCSAGAFEMADVVVEPSGIVTLWKGDPASSNVAQRAWLPTSPSPLAWVQSVTNPRVRKWTSTDGRTFTATSITRSTEGYTSWSPVALTTHEGVVVDSNAVLVTQSPGGAGGTTGQWRWVAWHGTAPATWGQTPIPDPTPSPTPRPPRSVSWQHLFAGPAASQVMILVECEPSCTLEWGDTQVVEGRLVLRRDFLSRPPDLRIMGSLARVTVIQSPAGTSDNGSSVTTYIRQ